MITEEKSCYVCGGKIAAIKSDYKKHNDDFIIDFVIDFVIAACPQGHKTTVHVMEDNGLD